jgi:hypothetical protein
MFKFTKISKFRRLLAAITSFVIITLYIPNTSLAFKSNIIPYVSAAEIDQPADPKARLADIIPSASVSERGTEITPSQPKGDLQTVTSIRLDQEPVGGLTIPLKKKNPRLRLFSPGVQMLGGSNYGYNWLSTLEDGDIYTAIYDTFAMIYEMGMEQQDDINYDTQSNLCYVGGFSLINSGVYFESSRLNEIEQVYEIFQLDNPQYFVAKNSFAYTFTTIGETSYLNNMYPLFWPEFSTYDVRYETSIRINEKYTEYKELVGDSTDPYTVVRLVHDKICAEGDYSNVNGEADDSIYAHSILGIMDSAHQTPVCEAFAEAFAYIINRISADNNIPALKTILVSGLANGDTHLWNLVSLDGCNTYYQLDITWDNLDDTYPYSNFYDENNKLNSVYYTYFLCGDNNANFGKGSMHVYAGTSKTSSMPYIQYELPTFAVNDYVPSNPPKYLTDNGLVGNQYYPPSESTIDDWNYAIGKGSVAIAELNDRNQNPFILNTNGNYSYNYGPYSFKLLRGSNANTLNLYLWDFNIASLYIHEFYTNPSALDKGTDYIISKIEPIDDASARIWFMGAGEYKGIDFVIGEYVDPATVTISCPITEVNMTDVSSCDMTISPSHTVTATDGTEFPNADGVTWAITQKPDNGDGITIDPATGIITIPEGTDTVTGGKSLMITASTGDISSEPFEITFTDLAPSSIVITGDDAITVNPSKDVAKIYSAQVLDQYGDPLPIQPMLTVSGNDPDGGNITVFDNGDNTATITVKKTAAADGTKILKIVANMINSTITAVKDVSVTRTADEPEYNTPGENNPISPGDNNPALPGENNPVSPGDNNPASPGDDNPVQPGDNNPASPGENNPAPPAEPTHSAPSTETSNNIQVQFPQQLSERTRTAFSNSVFTDETGTNNRYQVTIKSLEDINQSEDELRLNLINSLGTTDSENNYTFFDISVVPAVTQGTIRIRITVPGYQEGNSPVIVHYNGLTWEVIAIDNGTNDLDDTLGIIEFRANQFSPYAIINNAPGLTAITPPIPYSDLNVYSPITNTTKNKTPTLSNELSVGTAAKSPAIVSKEETQPTVNDEHSETENNDETNTDALTDPKVDTDFGISEGSVNSGHSSGEANKGVFFLVVLIALAIALIIIVITLVYRAKKME